MKKSDSRANIKLSKEPTLKPGMLSDKGFDLLLYFTDIRSEASIAALRAHYVGGLTKSQAYGKFEVDKSTFSRQTQAMDRAYQIAQLFLKELESEKRRGRNERSKQES